MRARANYRVGGVHYPKLSKFALMSREMPQLPGATTVLDFMVHALSPPPASQPIGAFAVKRPRATDAIGGALNGCFPLREDLPRDIGRLMDCLDRS